ncbi:MAG: AbrB/MazE/SpoVT family DNA-binding domain-containing protein [Elainellaceae cyanobacterium]
MFETVAKWGNSLAIRIPPHLANAIHISEGAEIELDVIDGNLVLKPRKRKQYSLDELLEGITPENLHTEIDMFEEKVKPECNSPVNRGAIAQS